MHVSAGNPFRRWPIASFATVASTLVSRVPGGAVVITSGPSEQDAAQRVIEEARSQLPSGARDRIVSCGEFSLMELRALVDGAALYIGGDSGPMHVASTSHAPIVGIYGPTLPERSAPWRPDQSSAEAVETPGLPCRPCEQRVCAPGDFRCLTWIQPAQVVEAAERLLARPR
jgi:ADP-heptose:LPS heptosyltransferase